jgi:hypothetical protein
VSVALPLVPVAGLTLGTPSDQRDGYFTWKDPRLMGKYLPRRLETPSSSSLPAAGSPEHQTLGAVDDKSFVDGRRTGRDGSDDIGTLRRVIDVLVSERNKLERQLETAREARDAAEAARQAADRQLEEVQQEKRNVATELEAVRQRICGIRVILDESKECLSVPTTVLYAHQM